MAETHYPGAAGHGAAHAHAVRHETRDINLGGVLAFAVGLFVVALVIHVLVWVLYTYFAGRAIAARGVPTYPLAVNQAGRVPPEPRLQTNPREDLRTLRDSEDAILNSYAWVDKNNGIVRIPIGDAMKLTLERGLPAREQRVAK
ncbi:MAG TPA: hypothetical protein VL309_04520 [Vicinamibacterales bacterium]|jgi:hypothetical protein|nr:hypothetical protein [Vicinamibacterales bacterium]